MADHRTLVSANVHEPKHISGTTVSDAGKVITPLSGGTSELRQLAASEITGLNITKSYGDMQVSNNTDAHSVTAVGDTTLNTLAQFSPITPTVVPGVSQNTGSGVSFNSADNTLTVSVGGVYHMASWMNIKSDANNTKFGFIHTVNSVNTGPVTKTDIKEIGRVANLAENDLITLSVGDVVGLAFASDKTTDITITDMVANLILVEEI